MTCLRHVWDVYKVPLKMEKKLRHSNSVTSDAKKKAKKLQGRGLMETQLLKRRNLLDRKISTAKTTR